MYQQIPIRIIRPVPRVNHSPLTVPTIIIDRCSETESAVLSLRAVSMQMSLSGEGGGELDQTSLRNWWMTSLPATCADYNLIDRKARPVNYHWSRSAFFSCLHHLNQMLPVIHQCLDGAGRSSNYIYFACKWRVTAFSQCQANINLVKNS